MSWEKYSYTCDPDHCDASVEITTKLPIVKPECFSCGRLMNLITVKNSEPVIGSVEDYLAYLKASGETGI